MPTTICTTCGTAYPSTATPEQCPTCLEERQYLPPGGQSWTASATLVRTHSVKVHRLHDRLYELEICPTFAIGQRAMLVLSEQGNVLWDCIPLLDEPIIDFIQGKGGLKAIAFSHPHYYSNMNDWAATFNCPIYIHQNDAEYIQVSGPHISLWQGDKLDLWDGISINLIGGHFAGSCILHVPFLSPEGSILCGDTLFLSPNKQHFSAMWSYPNRIPLPLSELQQVRDRVEAIPFDTFYGYHFTQNLQEQVREIFSASMDRYFL